MRRSKLYVLLAFSTSIILFTSAALFDQCSLTGGTGTGKKDRVLEEPGEEAVNTATGEKLIQPQELDYLGAFRLPEGSNGTSWQWGGTAAAYYPEGDPEGPDDGYPGSIFATGHEWEQQVSEIKKTVGNGIAINALSGGVDSSTVTVLGHRAIGEQLKTVFIDNALMREGEPQRVVEMFADMDIPVELVDAREEFLGALKDLTDPEQKRQAIIPEPNVEPDGHGPQILCQFQQGIHAFQILLKIGKVIPCAENRFLGQLYVTWYKFIDTFQNAPSLFSLGPEKHRLYRKVHGISP